MDNDRYKAGQMKYKSIIFIKLILLVAIIMMFPVFACADESGTCGTTVMWELHDNNLTITGTGAMDNFTFNTRPWRDIESEIVSVSIGEGVISIGDYAFNSFTSLKSISFPESMTKIGKFAFYGCINLTSVIIPDNVISIGNYSFACCNTLTSCILPRGLTNIEEFLFYQCNSLKNVVIPEGIVNIGKYAFKGCKKLSNVEFPESTVSIGDNAFDECTSLTYLVIPKNVVSIGRDAFYHCSGIVNCIIMGSLNDLGNTAFFHCSSLEEITVMGSVSRIGGYCFFECSSLQRVIIHKGFTSIDDCAFSGCHSLSSITISDGIIRIGEFAFYECYNLTHITIGDNLISIGKYAFQGCTKFERITIPESTISIGDGAFDACPKLNSICILGEKVSFGTNILSGSPTIYCYEYTDVETWATEQGFQIVLLDTVDSNTIRSISLQEKMRLALGESSVLPINIFPNHDKPIITWLSSDPDVVNVIGGVIYGLKQGTAMITAQVGSAVDVISIEVYSPAESYELNHSEIWLIAKESLQLSPIHVYPEGTELELFWGSSDTTLADVDNNGFVTTKSIGDVIVWSTDKNGIARECLIHLCYPVSAITFEQAEVDVPIGITVSVKTATYSQI